MVGWSQEERQERAVIGKEENSVFSAWWPLDYEKDIDSTSVPKREVMKGEGRGHAASLY